MSQNNSIKKLLNIKDKFLKIDKILDENIKGTLTKVVYATATKKNNTCPCCENKLVKNGFKRVNKKIRHLISRVLYLLIIYLEL